MATAGHRDQHRQAEGLLGKWLAHHHGYAELEADLAAELAEPVIEHEVEQPSTDPRAHEALSAAGAVLEAFAASMRQRETPADAGTDAPARQSLDDREPLAVDPGDQQTAYEVASLANSAAEAVLSALQNDRALTPAAEPAPSSEEPPEREPETETESDAAADAVVVAHDEEPPRPVSEPVPHDISFRPRAVARRVVGVLALTGLLATALAAWHAYDARTPTSIGIAAALAVLTCVLWAARASTTPALVTVTGSRLEIVRSGTRLVFDLADPRLDVEVVGTPGRPGWKVVIPRRNLAPAVVDASMVDPREFTRVVEFHRARLHQTA